MATISVTGPKDLIAMPALATGAGAVIPLVGGPVVAGVVAGLANIDVNNEGYMAAVNVATKLGIGAAGTYVAKQGGVVGNLGLGMALGGLAGAFADIVLFGISYTSGTARAGTTGASSLNMFGYKLVKGTKTVGLVGSSRLTGYGSNTAQATQVTRGLEILPRD